MELLAQYAYKVYEEASFTNAAKALYISQPALSASISRLEKELGFKIFDRSKVPLSLTRQGQIYIEGLEDILACEARTQNRLQQYSDMQYSRLSIGGSSSVCIYLLPEICAAFRKKYPHIRMTLDIGNIGTLSNLAEQLDNQSLDLMISYSKERKDTVFIPLLKEQLLVVMHKDMPGAEALKHLALDRETVLAGNYRPEQMVTDPSVFRDIPFITFHHTPLDRIMSQILGDYREADYVIKDSRHSLLHYNIVLSGIGAVFITNTVIRMMAHNSDQLLFFPLAHPLAQRTVYLARHTPVRKNPVVDNFITVATEVCAGLSWGGALCDTEV